MSPEREREYEELSAFLGFYCTNILGIDPSSPSHPAKVGRQIVEEFGKSGALEGLRQAVNDMVEEMSDLAPETISKLDADLRAAGIVTASEVRRRHAAAYKRILKRGKIRTETEFYLVNGIVSDFGGMASEEERGVLDRLLADYESGR